MKFIIIFFVFITLTFAINPPNKGKFPAKIVKILNENPDFIKYGDPGWLKKIETIKSVYSNLSKVSAVDISFKLPVLLGDFKDVAGTFSAPTFQDHLFDDNPTGTMTDYYAEISYNKFNLTGTVYGWFTSDQNEAYYQGDGNGYGGTFPANAQGYVYHIVSKADVSVNFGQFDNDGPDGIPNSGDDDGYVDGVCVVYPQAGADWNPGNDNFWPHMSGLGSNEFTTNDVSANGGNIKVSSYFICPEEAGGGNGNGSIRPIGVFTHEFGHVLGLPDLYDRTDDTESPDFEASEGLGEWCLMGSGSWGGDGSHTETPAHMSAWCKIQLGWITPTVIFDAANNVSVRQSETNAEALILWEDRNMLSRYFLVENRQKVGFDKYLNGTGLLIYHIDENQRWGNYRWSSGYVNDDETHKMVDLEEADGLANLDNSINRSDAGDPFPGTSSNTSFDSNSIPSSKDYNNMNTGVAVKDISASSSTMTIDVVPRQDSGYGIKYDEYGISGWAWGFSDPLTSWGGVLFTAPQEGILTAVDVGFIYNNLDYEVLVYQSFNGSQPGNLLASKSGHNDNSGWYTINFDSDVNISAGQNFFVVIKIQNQAYAISFDPIGIKQGRSYFSSDGQNFSATIGQNGDINLRARILTQDVNSIEFTENQPGPYILKQNYPNPFNPQTWISYQLADAGNVRLSVYDITGRLLETLVDQQQMAGVYSVSFNAANLASGFYFYKLETDRFSETRKMLLVK